MYAYNQMYLDDAMHNLAEALEAAKLRLNITLDSFMHMFICSGIASQFEIGNPKYVSGMSGTELVNEVLLKTYGSDADTLGNCKYSDPTPEYWTGWVLAYYQWFSGKTFKDIQKAMPIEELVDKYHPFHEGDETLVVEYIDRRFEIDAPEMTTAELMRVIEADPYANVTFSGGDPMYQAVGFAELAEAIHSKTRKDIWCFTGFTYESLIHDAQRELLENIDVLVDGPFIQRLSDPDLLFRGSSNQRIINVPATLYAGEIVLWTPDITI